MFFEEDTEYQQVYEEMFNVANLGDVNQHHSGIMEGALPLLEVFLLGKHRLVRLGRTWNCLHGEWECKSGQLWKGIWRSWKRI